MLHFFNIQLAVVMADTRIQNPRAINMVVNDITITACSGTESCMKFIRNRHRPAYCNILRQIRVGAHGPSDHLPFGGGIKVHHLPSTMYPRISSPSTLHFHWMIGNLTQRLF
ncbi:Uncharacterised protein [Vibrio cholerae]|nr:Uncharacterised protein [Vibrio cholerae]